MIHRPSDLCFARRAACSALTAAALPLLLLACGEKAPSVSVPPPPETRAVEVAETLHGVEVADPYRWLEDREAAETRTWIEEQNAYTDAVLAQLEGRDALKEKVTRLVKTDTLGFPTARGDRYFFSRRRADQEVAVIYLKEGRSGEEQPLIDPHPWSEDHSLNVTLLDVSKDGKLLAFGVRQGGKDEITVRLFDVEARADLEDELPEGRYFGVVLRPDKAGFYYTRHGREGSRVRYHALGTAAAADTEIFGEGYGPGEIIIPNLSPDGRWLTLNVLYGSAADKSEIHLLDLESGGAPRPVVTDLEARFFGGVAEGRLLLQTNWEAPNQRIFLTEAEDPVRENWREIVPEREDAVIRGVSGAGGRIFVNYLQDVRSRVVAFDREGTELTEIGFDTLGTVTNVSGEWDQDEAFFVFTSFHVPTTIYRYQVSTGEKEVWDRIEIPVDTSGFEVRQVFFPSKDGTEVPMFLVHRQGLELDGSNPTLLTGYGGFNVSLTPFFSANTALWVESGGVYAVANLRGGGEYGEEWHRAGMRDEKQNVFDDFIAAAEWLIESGYTRPEKLAVQGGSNGGLLVGAMLTQRPDLFEAVVCAYPLLDMVRYHRFMVAPFWVPEYGSAEDPELFPYLLGYSPYHNVAEGGDYPAVLFVTGDGDTRVAPLHARKMAARVQAASGSGEPVLLRYHTKAGHSGGQSVSDQIENTTDAMSFLAWQLGLEIETEVPQPAAPER